MVDPARIIAELNRASVEYVVVGGVAATLHGCPEQTYDLDVLYRPTPENRHRLLAALQAIDAQWDRPLTDQILQTQPVFALNTKFGDLDIFTSIPGLDSISTALASAQLVTFDDNPAKILDLATLIATKEAAADPNPRKQAALAFLKQLRGARP